jgi:hypothetical protein
MATEWQRIMTGATRCSKGQEYKNVILYPFSFLLSAVATADRNR